MSLIAILDNFYDTTVTVQRRTVSVDSIGAIQETWSSLATSVKATIQPLTVVERAQLAQGDSYTASFRAFMPVDVITIKAGDKIIDTGNNNEEYLVKGVNKFRSARSTITSGHHYEIYLEIPKQDAS